MAMKKKVQEKKTSFVRLTKLDGSPIWLNASFVVTVEPRKGGGSVVVPIGDGLDYDVREAPEAVLACLDGAPLPEVVPVPASDALTPTPDDVSPEDNKGVVTKDEPAPSFAAAPAPVGATAGELLEGELLRLRKMAPRTVKKLHNTIMTQFKAANAEAVVATLVSRGVLAIDGTRVNWLEPETEVKMEVAAPAVTEAPAAVAPKAEKKPAAKTGRKGKKSTAAK